MFLFRCSSCPESSCSTGKCINFAQLCDGTADCPENDDESDCRASFFRLADGKSDMSGNLEVMFRSKWEPVCADELEQLDNICQIMRLGDTGSFLRETQISGNSTKSAWKIIEDRKIMRVSKCRKLAKISCQSSSTSSISLECGARYVEINARDARRARIARVVGGFETQAGAFPWTAALKIKKTGEHQCGASIIGRRHLITAAHCFEEDDRPSSYQLIIGEWDNNKTEGTEQIFDLKRITFYPTYKDIFSHDIAILEIDDPGIIFDLYSQPICLPDRDFVYTPGRQCVVSGWGSMGLRYAQRLQAALIPIIDRSECQNSSEIYESMSRTAFCAGYLEGGVDSCQGDSGGPFACRREKDGAFVLAGVISWGDGCAQKKQPGIYTMVAPYLSWINSVLIGQEM
ncbi:unnamed protein product [Caenorhabditis angaria]|uniref:Peptidase S1 domain-containing protein n=1 Tax=Caenorhabditis angaria TaxID=860376 RepID=A0A9P1IMA0_9PELO|nr:unnamed protein product [Caenorhabditis angaria]